MNHARPTSGNPFATRHTRPGRLLPRAADGAPLDLSALLARVRAPSMAAIEGPHGAGKTNLLTTIAGLLAESGSLADLVRSRTKRDGPVVLGRVARARPGTTLCVDSWDTVGPVWAAMIRWTAHLRRVGLLVTSHRPTGLPTILRCDTTASLLARLVADLPTHGGRIESRDIEQAFTSHRGDIREALYDLYDRFERRVRTA